VGYTLYDILGVEPKAPAEKIRAIYRLRTRETYPRRPGVGNEEVQKQLNEAYEILKDPDKRRAYNEQMGLPLSPRSLKPGRTIFQEIEIATQSTNRPISYTFSRWEPCPRCWGEGCSRCRGKGKTRETVNLAVTIPPDVSQVLVEGQGAVGEPGGNRGDLILYVVWVDLGDAFGKRG
jgi:DnaJ-class molecular chaperone